MNSFSFVNKTRLFMGVSAIDNLKEEIHVLGDRILLHYGKASIKKNGIYDEVKSILDTMDVEVYELGGVSPNPELPLVLEGIEMCKKYNITGILAVGGGSVIDSSKGIAAGYYVDNIEEYYMSGTRVDKALPLGCILTIPAAGSESSPSSVVTVGDGLHKRSIKSEVLYPAFAIVNPAYFTSLSAENSAIGMADIFSHLLERYFTHTEHVDYTDRLLEGSMISLKDNSLKVMEDLSNVDARSEVGFIGTLAHNGLLGSGREEDWASHRIEHELSAKYNIPHGAGLAIVFPAWMKHVWKENPRRFVQFANRVMNIEGDDEATILKGIEAYESYLKSMGLPTRLSDLDIEIEDINEIVENCYYERPEYFGNFKHIYREDMKQILELAK